MVSQRSVYIKFLAIFFAVALFYALNHFLFKENAVDKIYGLLFDEKKSIDTAETGFVAYSESLENENAALRKQLGLEQKNKLNLLAAKITSVERNSVISYIVVNKGSNDGVKIGDISIASGNILIGKVVEVYTNHSRIRLIDDPESVISVKIYGGKFMAESIGALKNEFQIDFVAHGENIEKGALVVTSGLDDYPEGFAVGTVEMISDGTNSLFKEVYGKTLFNFYETSLVFIVI